MTNTPLPKNIIHLCSGGLDSVVLMWHLRMHHNVHCLLIDYGQQHVQELEFARLHCHRAKVLYTKIELPAMGGLTQETAWIVPNRNAVFISIAVNYAVTAGADTVTIGCNKGDAEGFPDCRPSFIAAMNSAVKEAGYQVEICAPFLEETKAMIARLGQDMKVPMNETWTCYVGGQKPCGKCPACLKFNAAMAALSQ
jgi:7-cyano-7-deazaguanine synthase